MASVPESSAGLPSKKARRLGKVKMPSEKVGIHHVVLVSLHESANFNDMPPARMDHSVLNAENILRQFHADRGLRTKAGNAADIDVSERSDVRE